MPDVKNFLAEHGPKLALMFMAAKQGGPQAVAGLMEGIQARQHAEAQRQRQGMMDSQNAELHQAQMGNLQADNARADDQLRIQKFHDLSALIDRLSAQEGETATDPQAAQAAIQQRGAAAAGSLGLPTEAVGALVPNMAPVITGRDKKRAQEILDRLEKNKQYDGYRDSPEGQAQLDELNVPWADGSTKKIRELRAMVGQATTDTGQPLPPKAPKDIRIVDLGGTKQAVDINAVPPGQTFKETPNPNALSAGGNEPIAPDDVNGAAQAILARRMAPSQLSLVGGMGNRGVKFKQAVVAAVNKQDPQFNWQEAESTFQFGKATGTQNTVRYMESVQESMPRLLASAQKLANGKVRAINTLINAGKNQVNDVDLKAFQTDVLLVADEVAKILQGGGTGNGTSDAKLRQASSILSTSDSLEAIASALGEVNTLIGYRRDSLTKGTFMEKPAAAGAPIKVGKYTVTVK